MSEDNTNHNPPLSVPNAGVAPPPPPAPVAAAHPAPVAYAPPSYPAQQVAPKNPAIALLASFFFPGLGTMMNGQAGVGITIFVAYMFSWVASLILIGIPFLIGIWIWGMVHAYTGAKSWNARHGIIS